MMLRRRSANPYRIGAAVCKVCCADGDAQIIRLYATMDDLGSAEDRASITGGGHVGLDNYGGWTQAGMCELFSGNVCHAGIEANFGCGLRHPSGERAQICGHGCLPRSRRTRAIRRVLPLAFSCLSLAGRR